METFDGPLFLHEIEWLIPEGRVGSVYEAQGQNDGHDGKVTKVQHER
jgi:hypothetical protein